MDDLVITDEMKQVMVNAARRAFPSEACGVIAGGVCYELKNRSDDPTKGFRLLGQDIARVAARVGGYAGVWHSHPSGSPIPSRVDWANHPTAKALVIVAGETVSVYYGDEA